MRTLGEPRHDRDTPMSHFRPKSVHRDTAIRSDAVSVHGWFGHAEASLMGLSHEQHAELVKNLQPASQEVVSTQPANEVEDATIGNEQRLRGIPAVGRVSGTMTGTRPGIDDLRSLERAGHLIINGMLQRTRRRDHP